MQLLHESSAEGPALCLGVIPGETVRLAGAPGRPVPHMGWNTLDIERPSPLLEGLGAGDYAYFVHSYAVPEGPATIAQLPLRRGIQRLRRLAQFLRRAISPGALRRRRCAAAAQFHRPSLSRDQGFARSRHAPHSRHRLEGRPLRAVAARATSSARRRTPRRRSRSRASSRDGRGLAACRRSRRRSGGPHGPGNRALIAELARESGLKLQVGGGLRTRHRRRARTRSGRRASGDRQRGAVGSGRGARMDRRLRRRTHRPRLRRAPRCGRHSLHRHPWVATAIERPLWEVLAEFPGVPLRTCSAPTSRGTVPVGAECRALRGGRAALSRIAWQASGGIRDAADLQALASCGVAAAISGKALLEDLIPVEELRPFLPNA
jgi:hypothetical protein